MICAPVPVGARLVDCVTVLTAASACALRQAGVQGAIRYLGSLTAPEAAAITEASLGLMAVTYADRFSGSEAVAELTAIDYPAGATAWLDVEGLGTTVDVASVIVEINAWASAVVAAGWVAGLYVGAQSLLTSQELTALAVTRYWRGQSRIDDRTGKLAEPLSGFCLVQLFPTSTIAGVNVDVDFAAHDWRGRGCTWATALPSAVATDPDVTGS